jgi:hypothetical protein
MIYPNLSFFGYSPVAQEEWTLLPGIDYTFRYRIIAWEGKAGGPAIEACWRDFAEPPEVRADWVNP